MDITNPEAFNFLYISPENKDDIQEFIKIATTLIKQNKIVLLFTRQHVDFMSSLVGLNKEQMKHFIISYHSDIKTIIGKLLELHEWTFVPDLVLLNLNSFYDFPNGDRTEAEPQPQVQTVTKPRFDEVCFCISTLLNYMLFLREKKCSKSVVMLNSHSDVNIQILVDFYFYKMAAFDVIAEVQNKILNI
ncbi:uncharacterized protein LOC129946805 [Eupeodes corollae]|uniref:uncharacterized protein LOC129946805 n=1 Tax=Eupeodes corollae TaxID=290404 RepID=UPI0024938D1A|nr:uncharacterized protein LOC129946805 [Eupeodes corollae]